MNYQNSGRQRLNQQTVKTSKIFRLFMLAISLIFMLAVSACNGNFATTEQTDKEAIPLLRSTGKPMASLKVQSFNSKKELSFTPKTNQHLTIITLWSPTWFDDCKTQIEALKKFQRQYSSNLRIMALVYDTPLPTAQKLIKSEKINFEMALGNQQLYDKLQVKSIPSYWFLDSDGNLLSVREGLMTYEDLQKQLKVFYAENVSSSTK
ncbi:MAG: TlpA family protein disulfide reductase [Candidatus Bruticola sp.]